MARSKKNHKPTRITAPPSAKARAAAIRKKARTQGLSDQERDELLLALTEAVLDK